MSYQQNNHYYRTLPQSRKRQQGVVIIIALFIIALVATMAYVMMARLDRDTERTGMLLHNMQAEAYSQGSLAWAIDVLQSNAQNAKKYKQMDILPVTSPESDVDGYKISSTITDAQALFNINTLFKKEQIPYFKSLLRFVDPKLSSAAQDAIILAVQDWLNDNGNEELTKYYAELPTPYRPAHQLFNDASELLLIKGVTPQLYKALQPYIIALPGTETKMNIQTLSAELIMLLSSSITPTIAQTVLTLRKQQPFNDVGNFTDLEIIRGKISDDVVKSLTIRSDYFLVETQVAHDEEKLVLYTLLERDSSNDGKVRIIWQSKGLK